MAVTSQNDVNISNQAISKARVVDAERMSAVQTAFCLVCTPPVDYSQLTTQVFVKSVRLLAGRRTTEPTLVH